MEFKSMEKWRVMQMYNMSERQYKRLEARIIKRHLNEYWILRLEDELNFPHDEFEYEDISLKDLRKYFDKSKDVIGVAVNKMEKRNDKSFKYIKDGKVMINKEGVKRLSEKYFRKKHLSQLEFYKLELQNVKKKKWIQRIKNILLKP